MPKHILAIVSSPRKNGNSELLVDQFIAGADAAWILEKMLKADGLLFSSPTYKSCMCAQMKTLADRMYAINHILRGKDVYFIVTGAEPHREGLAACMQSMRGIVGFYKEMHIRAELYGTGVMQKGAVAAAPPWPKPTRRACTASAPPLSPLSAPCPLWGRELFCPFVFRAPIWTSCSLEGPISLVSVCKI